MRKREKIATLTKSVLIKRTESVFTQAFRFGIVGAVATIADWSTYGAATRVLHFHYLEGQVAGYTVGITVSFLLSIKWVFAARTLGNRALDFVAFALVGIIGLALTSLLMWIGVDKLRLFDLLAKAIATVLVFFWNFGARRILMFKIGH